MCISQSLNSQKNEKDSCFMIKENEIESGAYIKILPSKNLVFERNSQKYNYKKWQGKIQSEPSQCSIIKPHSACR